MSQYADIFSRFSFGMKYELIRISYQNIELFNKNL